MKNFWVISLALSFAFSFSVTPLELVAKGAGNVGSVGGSSSASNSQGGGTLGAKSLGTQKGVVSNSDGGGNAAVPSTSGGSTVDLLVNGKDRLITDEPATYTLSWTSSTGFTECKGSGDSAGGWGTSGYSLSRAGSRVLSNVSNGNYSYTISCHGNVAENKVVPGSFFAQYFANTQNLIAGPQHGGRDPADNPKGGGRTFQTLSDTVTVTVRADTFNIIDIGTNDGGTNDGGGGGEEPSITATPSLVEKNGTTRITWNGSGECEVRGSNGDNWTGAAGSETTSEIEERTTYTLTCDDESIRASVVVNIAPFFEEF